MGPRSLALALALATLGAPGSAGAQEAVSPRLEARSLGEEGLELFARGSWAEALDRFTRANERVPAPTFLLYMARCRVQLGHLAVAKELYDALLRQELPADAPEQFRAAKEVAHSERAALLERLAPTPPAPPPPAAIPSDAPPPSGSLVPAAVAFGVGALGLGVGVVAGLIATAKADGVKAKCAGTTCPTTLEGEADAAKAVALVSTVGFVAGGIGVGAGVVLLVVRPNLGSSRARTPLPGSAVVAWTGRF